MSRADLSLSLCTVARTAEIVGEAWTLVILRELFLGQRRFDALQTFTGASPPLLSQRLKRLEAEGIVARRRYCDRPPRDEYRLTEQGRDLWPVIVALKSWGDRWRAPDGVDPVRIVHKGCGKVMSPRLTCPECGEPLQAQDAEAQIDPAFAAEREGRRTKTGRNDP